MRTYTLFLTLAVTGMDNAQAGTDLLACESGDAPSGYVDETCAVSNGEEEREVCRFIDEDGESWTFFCDLDMGETDSTASPSGVVVSHYNGSSRTLSAWGTTSNGEDFCCTADVTDDDLVGANTVFLHGTSIDDDVAFRDGAETLQSADFESLSGLIEAGDGADQILGSHETAKNYTEDLDGQEGDDTIQAGQGNDTCYGGADDDVIDGGLGSDVIDGGSGNDFADGGPGVDTCIAEGQALCEF